MSYERNKSVKTANILIVDYETIILLILGYASNLISSVTLKIIMKIRNQI